MISLTSRSSETASYTDDEQRWQAVAGRDRAADGQFCYSVRTTGVYCRPSCGARRARRENVAFHRTPADAERAGFRPCRRCRPDQPPATDPHSLAIARACRLIAEAEAPPNVDALAGAVGMSLSHFHRVFKLQTGSTPRAYAAAQRAQRLRSVLPTSPSVTSAIYHAGFNSNGRFYSSATRLLGMTPTTFRAGGKGATIRFAVSACSLGWILVAATGRGICSIALGDDPEALVEQLKHRFAHADLIAGDDGFQRWVAGVVDVVERPGDDLRLPLEVQGTAFQHRVWRRLMKIPCGQTRTYGQIAAELGTPNATRAVASACAANPVAVAIPCHRVVRSDGSISGYRWGAGRKRKLLDAERRQRTIDAPRGPSDAACASPTIRRHVVPREAKG